MYAIGVWWPGCPQPRNHGLVIEIQWLWAMKIGFNKPWRGLDVPSNVKALFSIAIKSQVGSGTNTLFGVTNGYSDALYWG